IRTEIRIIDEEVTKKIDSYQMLFNKYWGPFMRSGQEESRLANQIDKYSCVYMSHISDFLKYSPRHYFRPKRRPLPHES
ncbi:MAG: 5'-nucleotidase, partial [Oligoflexia bacterium]|nr:5'-nucleotidase [Oligoflexia bacterium]